VPDRNYHGSDSLTYTARDQAGTTASGAVSIVITAVNDAPVAVDDTLRLAEDSGTSTVAVLDNDSDPDGDQLAVTSVSDPQHGSIALTPAGGLAYTPAGDFNGPDRVAYRISDGHGGSTTAAVDIVVSPVNDPPAVGPSAYATRVGQTLNVNAANGVLASASDVEGDALTVTGDDSAAVDVNANGSFRYTALVVGTRTVHFQVSDGKDTTTGTMTITVTLLAAGQQDLYLQPGDTDQIASMDPSAPAGVSDWDHDGKPGLTIKSSDLKESLTDEHKFQTWSYTVPGGGLSLNGPVALDLWTSLQNKANEDLEYAAWVYDCAPGGGCTTLLATGRVAVSKWSTTTTWEEREVTLGSVSDTVPAGHLLRMRLMFNKRDVWMPLDSAHASKVSLTTG
jgi:Bacterial Ig domain